MIQAPSEKAEIPKTSTPNQAAADGLAEGLQPRWKDAAVGARQLPVGKVPLCKCCHEEIAIKTTKLD